MTKTSVTALLAAAFLGGTIAAASACEWQKQVMAKAAPPAVEEQTEAEATPIDPVLLAKLEAMESEATVEK